MVKPDLADRPVSETLTYLILFAQLIGDDALERWAKLESDGYLASNPALRDDDVLPEYRSVTGLYRDSWGRPLIIQDPKTAAIVQNEILRADFDNLAVDSPVDRLDRNPLSVRLEPWLFANMTSDSLGREARAQGTPVSIARTLRWRHRGNRRSMSSPRLSTGRWRRRCR